MFSVFSLFLKTKTILKNCNQTCPKIFDQLDNPPLQITTQELNDGPRYHLLGAMGK